MAAPLSSGIQGGPPPGQERYGRTYVLATQIRQKDGIFYFGSVRAPELLVKVRLISRFYGDGEDIAPARISPPSSSSTAAAPRGSSIAAGPVSRCAISR